MASELENLRKQAAELFEQEKFKEIIELLSDDVLVKYKDAELYAWRARAHYRLRDNPDTIMHYAQKAIDADRNYWIGYMARGAAFNYKGEYDNAITDYTKSIDLKPDDRAAYMNRGNVWYNKGEYDNAIADYTKAIELKSDDADAYYNRGIAWAKNGGFDKAIEDFNEAIKLKPGDALAYNNRGLAWDDKCEYDKAIEDYTKAIELNDVVAYNNRGIAWTNKGDYDKALADFNKAIELNPKYEHAYSNRGMCYLKSNFLETALQDLEKAVCLNPKFPFGFFAMSIGFKTANNPFKRLINLNRAIYLRLNNKSVIPEVIRFYVEGYPFIAQRLTDNFLNLENYIGIDKTYIEVSQQCRPVKRWLNHIYDTTHLQPIEKLKWLAVFNYFMGDVVTAFKILDKIESNIDDLQTKFYYYKAALLIYPEIPDKNETESIERDVVKCAITELEKGMDKNSIQFYYAMQILFCTGNYADLIKYGANSQLNSVQSLLMRCNFENNPSIEQDNEPELINNANNDFIVPDKKIEVPVSTVKNNNTIAEEPKEIINEWIDLLNKVIRYYEMEEDALAIFGNSKGELLRFWEVWDSKDLYEKHKVSFFNKIFDEEVENISEVLLKIRKNGDEAIHSKLIGISAEATVRNYISDELRRSEGEILNNLHSAIRDKQFKDMETVVKMILFFFHEGRLKPVDFVVIIAYAEIVYNSNLEKILKGLEIATKLFSSNGFTASIQGAAFRIIKSIINFALKEGIKDFEGLKAAYFENRKAELTLLETENFIIDDFPLSIFNDIEELFQKVGKLDNQKL